MNPKRAPGIDARILPDGYVVLHSQSNDLVHTLTPQGGLVWEFCDGESSIEQIQVGVSALLGEAAASAVTLTQVKAIISELSRLGLLQQ